MARKHSSAGAGTKLMTPVVKPAAFVPKKGVADDSRATVTTAPSGGRARQGLIVNASSEPIELSSDSEDDDEDDAEGMDEDGDEDVAEEEQLSKTKRKKAEANKAAAATAAAAPTTTTTTSTDADHRARSESPAAPTFGDLIQATTPVTVDVSAVMAQQAPEGSGRRAVAAVQTNTPATTAVAPSSLATVLAQALRTDDRELLESCLQVTDLGAVRGTIQRLDSRLAIVLLGKLADRMHRRPGRVGSLMVWVQWTMVSHGGALAGNRGAVQKLAGLQRVLEERARGLPSLLALKGKLDLLEGQMQLRQAHRAGGMNGGVVCGDEDDADVVFVEGDDQRRRRGGGVTNGVASKLKALQAAADGLLDSDDEDDGDDDDGVAGGDADSEEDEEDDDESDDDDEDEEGVEESGDEDDVDHDDVDEDDESDDNGEEEEAPPAKKRR
jgi:U3 small nucleolar RNA-associated protein 5